jgi:hypothetical protein
METPLVPNELSSGTRKLLSVGTFVVFAFVLVTVCLTVWYGVQEYHGGFVIVAISTIILLVCTGVLINLMRQDKLEDKVKYVTLAQSLGLILLSASLFAVIFGPTAAPTYSVGGSVSGLQSQGLSLSNDLDGQIISQFDTSCGPWTFPNKVVDGTSWRLSIKSQPSDAECVIMAGSTGSVKGKDASAIRIACTVKYTIGGRVSGLAGTDPVVLLNGANGGRDTVSVSANGNFAFPTAVPANTPYQVTVQTQPRGQICTVVDGTGTVTNAPISSIVVGCS